VERKEQMRWLKPPYLYFALPFQPLSANYFYPNLRHSPSVLLQGSMSVRNYEINKLSGEATMEAVSVGEWTKSEDGTFESVNGIDFLTNKDELIKVCDRLLKTFRTLTKVQYSPHFPSKQDRVDLLTRFIHYTVQRLQETYHHDPCSTRPIYHVASGGRVGDRFYTCTRCRWEAVHLRRGVGAGILCTSERRD
jgi:hypothetical protein